MNADVAGLKIGLLSTYPELRGGQEAGKCNLIVVVLSFNGVAGYGQIEVDSLNRVWVVRVSEKGVSHFSYLS